MSMNNLFDIFTIYFEKLKIQIYKKIYDTIVIDIFKMNV